MLSHTTTQMLGLFQGWLKHTTPAEKFRRVSCRIIATTASNCTRGLQLLLLGYLSSALQDAVTRSVTKGQHSHHHFSLLHPLHPETINYMTTCACVCVWVTCSIQRARHMQPVPSHTPTKLRMLSLPLLFGAATTAAATMTPIQPTCR
jgi:hypothetical protein